MNAKPAIREHLLARRMKYWLDIARTPLINTNVPTWRARKNFWALQKRHPDLAKLLGLSEVSVFGSNLPALVPHVTTQAGKQPGIPPLRAVIAHRDAQRLLLPD